MALEEIRRDRLGKLERYEAAGQDPYPASVRRNFLIGDVSRRFAALSRSKRKLGVTGRLRAWREHGGVTFGNLEDASGAIQLSFDKGDLGEAYALALGAIDIGDFLEVVGTCFKTKRGEPTLKVSEWRIIAKSLLSLPEKWHGLKDVEERFRKRYLDFVMNPGERDLFERKSRFWHAIRSYMLRQGFLEVETPVLEHTPGGADAEPFVTHLNALNIDLYLRISLELPLKRLVVGGFERVFEIGRIFRNEGIDREHLQDYTQIEFYWAYADYRKLMPFVEALYKFAIKETLGRLTHSWNNQKIDWSKPWPEVDYYKVFQKHTELDLCTVSDDELEVYAIREGIEVARHPGRGRLIDSIYKKKVRPTFIQPAFLVHPPVAIEPLAKRWSEDPGRVERFQVVACASELGKGFSELNDPRDQRARFEEQESLRRKGDTEAQRLDDDFLEALEYGMPPTAGFGASERLFAVIMNRSVRETVSFPLMRPR